MWSIWERQRAVLFVDDALGQLAGQQDFTEALLTLVLNLSQLVISVYA